MQQGQQSVAAGEISLVDPARASVGVTVAITGTGFHTTARNNEVVFTSSQGDSTRVAATSISTVVAVRGIRRLSVRVPALPDGPVSVRIVNTVSLEESNAASLFVVSLTPDSTSLTAGETRELVVVGSNDARFVAGSTKVSLGAGITVGAVTIESPTRLRVAATVAPNAAPGPRVLEVLAPGMFGATSSMQVVAASTNEAPQVNAGSDQSVTLPAAAMLAGTATDDGKPAGSTLAVQWAQVSGPGTTTFAAQTSASTSATFSVAGTYVLRLSATDGTLSASDDVTVTVNAAAETNDAPQVNAGGNQAVTLPAAAMLAGTATDDGKPAGSTLAVQWAQVSGPGTTTFAAATSASTSATFSVAGTYVLRLSATDGTLSASDDVTVTVNAAAETNEAPQVNAGSDQSVTLPAAATLAGTATDDGKPAGRTLAVQWAQVSGPGTTTFAAATSASTSATFSVAGTYVLRLSATDGTLSASDDVTVTVNAAAETNDAPQVNAGGNQAVTLPAAAMLAGTATDDGKPTGSTLAVQWSQVSGPGTTTFAAPTSASTSATFSVAGTYVLRLSATDGTLSATDDVTVTVNAAAETNEAPQVNAGSDQSLTLPAAATLSGTATDDGKPAGSTLAVQWAQVSGPGTTTFAAPTSASTSATFSVAGTYVLRLSATDGTLSASDDVTVTVTPESTGGTEPLNTAPSADAGADFIVTLPALATLTGQVSDDGQPIGSTLVVQWTLVSGPANVEFTAPGLASTTARFPLAGTYRLRLSATDGALSATDDVIVSVRPAVPPPNAAPTVTVDPDVTVTLPAPIALTATATDDGRPTASTLVTTWEQRSGPGVLLIDDRGARQTQARATVPGTYLVRFTADDGSLSAGSDVSITVLPAVAPTNAAPTVEVTGASVVTLPGTLALSARVEDDGRPAGGTLTTTWQQVSGPGQVTFSAPAGPATQVAFPQAGAYRLAAAVSDGTLTTSAHLDVTVSPAAALNSAPRVSAGAETRVVVGTPLALEGRVEDDDLPSGAQRSQAWSRLHGPGVVSFAAPGSAATTATFGMPGRYVLTLTATDGELVGVDEVTVDVIPANGSDLLPPVLTLSAPSRALPGQTVRVLADVADDIGVVDVVFSVDGEARPADATVPYETTVALPDVAAPGQRVVVRATARDASGRTGSDERSIEIASTPDTVAPTLELTVPAQTAPGSTLTAIAIASDDVGVDRVEFFIDNTPVAADGVAPFVVEYEAPTTAGSSLSVRAEAVDAAGNRTSVTRQVPVIGQADTTAPVVTLGAASQAAPGTQVPLTAVVDDASARVRFFVQDALLREVAVSPYEAMLQVPEVPVGTVLVLRAEAHDLAGNVGTSTRELEVVSRAIDTAGIVSGQVIDDVTGLPLAGARVRLLPTAPAGLARQVLTNDAGRYEVDIQAGPVLTLIDLDGYTSSARSLDVVAQRVAVVTDARLTRRGPANPGGGAQRLEIAGVQVDVAAGAVTSGALSLTAVSGQALGAPLPAGWAPIVAFELAPASQRFALPVVIRATVPTLPAGRAAALVRWEDGTVGWRVVDPDVTASAGVVEQAISGAGHYALVLADAMPAVPPLPAAGSLLSGVSASRLTDADIGLVTPDPRVLFASPDARSVVTGTVSTATPSSSGLRAQARLLEQYAFFDGATWQPLPRTQDVVLYQQPASASTLVGQFAAAPSRQFDATALQRGVITVELRAPAAPGGGLVGRGGGVVVAPDDELVELGVGPGLLDVPSRIGVQRVAAADLGLALPTGVVALDAFAVTLPDVLAAPASLLLPGPTGADPSRLVLARLVEVGGRTHLALSGLLASEGQGLRVTQQFGPQSTLLAGVRQSGTYVLVQAPAPVGLVSGRVVDAAGQSIVGALVTPGTFPVVALSTDAGGYVAAAPTGGLVLTGADVSGTRRGERPVVLTAGVVTPATLTLLPVPPQVTSTRPAAGDTDVLLDDSITVTFSRPIAPTSIVDAVRLIGAGGAPVSATTILTRGDTVLEIRPVAPLAAATSYTVTVAASVTDRAGIGLAQPVTLAFQTVDRVQPETPAAGTITASVPDRSGNVTVRGTQGTATQGYQVFIENLTRRTSQVALVNADGSFAAGLRASVTDALRVRIVDPSGNSTTVDVDAMRQVNPDGSVSQAVTAAGGVVDGPEGTRAVVKAGTFPEGATVTMKALPVTSFPRQLTPAEQENFSLEKAISLDFDGATPQQYIDVSWPAGPNDKPTDQWVLTESVFVNGEWAMNVTDTVKYRDGRLTTASPPCPGVTAAAVYGLLKSSVPYGLNYAQMYADGRYKLKMSMEVFQGSPIAIPYAAFSTELPRSICFPAFVGRMSISPNSTRITVSGMELRPSDTALIVESNVRPTPLRFDRTVAPFHLKVSGYSDDSFVVYAIGPGNAEGTRVRSTRYNQPRAFVDLGDVDRQILDFVFDAVGVSTGGPIEPVTLVVDPADVTVPVTAFKVVALRSNRSMTMQVRDQLMTVNVPGGGAGEVYTVKAVTPRLFGTVDDTRPVDFLAVASAGEGNLVLRASPGTIDPTRAEMGSVSGPARTRFTLASSTPDFAPIEIPADRIVQGGLEFAFDGVEGATYRVITEYDTRPPFSLELPTVRYVLRNVNTNQVLKTIFGQAPPRDEPVELPPLTDDDIRPSLLAAPSRMDTFDPAGLLTFRFSESMAPASLRTAIVVRDGSQHVKGQVRISDQNRVVTFVPDVPLQLDERYTVEVRGGDGGARDLAGNAFEKTVSFDVTTFIPRSLGVTTGGDPALIFKDTAWLFRDDGTTRRRHLFAVLGSQVNNVRWFDGTDPARLQPRASASSSPSLQRIAAIDTDKLPVLGPGKQMLVATTMFSVERSALEFFRATEPGQLEAIGGLPLTINSSTWNPLNRTVRGIGYARNVVLHETEEGVRAIVAVEKYGVMSADVKTNIAGSLERTENAYPMNGIVDIAGYGDGVVAVATTPERNTFVAQLGPSLDLVGRTSVPSVARSVTIGRGVAIDIDRNGEVTPDERGDIAVVGTQQGLQIVRLAGTDGTADPVALFGVPFSGVVKQVEIDEERSRVIVLVDEGSTSFLQIVDLARGDIDPPDTGRDPRIIFSRVFPAGANGMRLDRQAGLLYIPTPSGLDTWLVADRCCDLGVELTADLDKKARSVVSGDLGDVLKKELAAIKRGVVLGLQRAEERCSGFDVSKLKLIESGSSGCLWSADPVRACGSNYQPLVSDHDISTFMPDDWYQRKVGDPDWDGEGTQKQVLLAGCVVAALSFPFTDPYSEEPKPVGESGLVFKDISFIPNYVADFDSMEYRLERTIEDLPGDVDNDLAMGRQLLVMKHLTEAYGVDLRGTEGYKSAYAAVMVDEADFETRFERFRNVTRIPEVEGYEWGVLMQFMLAKAKAYLRFKGASDERSSFNDFYVKQYHTAAKAGIRAAAARLVADTASRDLFLQVTREDETKGLPVFRKDACLVYQPGQSPLSWPAKACGSMEEYVAATAARSLRLPNAPFTEGQVLDVYKYYRVKADEQPIVSEAEADQFIADVHNFVMFVKRTAYPVYRDLIASDPRAAEREGNRKYAEGDTPDLTAANPGGRIKDFLSETKVTVKPKVYNRGFMSAPNVYLRAYIAPPGGAPALACVGQDVEGEDPDPALRDRCRLALNLNGGAQIFPAYRDGSTGAYLPQPNSRAIDAFPLVVDQRAAGQVGHIVFTIDLPERSANEGDRTNNVGGAQFYILDPRTGTAPQMPAEPPNPVNPQLLAPDPYCLRTPQLTVTQSVTLDGKEQSSPVPAYLGAKFALNIHVTNTGSTPVENVLACSSLISDPRANANAATCLNIGGIAPGATRVRSVDMTMPTTSTNFESLATAKDQRLGVSSASLLRIGAKCEPMLVELSPNPNALAEPVALGGRAVRHYMAIHPVSSEPATGVRVVLRPQQGVTLAGYTYVSGADGLIDTTVGGRTIDGMAVPTITGNGVKYELESVNGLQPECGKDFAFTAKSLNVFRYTQSIEAGSAIKAGLSIFNLGPSGEASFGGGLKIESNGIARSFTRGNDGAAVPYESRGEDLADVTWERKAAVSVSGGFRYPGFTAAGEFRGQFAGQAEGLKIDLSGSAAATQAYRYFFGGNPTSWGPATRGAFAALLFPTVSEAEAATFRELDQALADPLISKVLSTFYDAEAPYRPFRTNRIGALAINGSADAVGFKGTIDFIDKESNQQQNPEGDENKTTPLFSASAAGSAALAIGYEKDERLTVTAVDETVRELVHTIDIDGKYNWQSSYATSFDRAADDIDGSNQAQAVKDKVKELLKWVQTRLSNSATGDLDGGIRFRVHAKPVTEDQRARFRVHKLEVGFRTQKTYGFTTLGSEPLPDSGNDYRINFVIEGEEQAEWIMNQAIGRGAVFVQLLSDAQKQRTTEFLNALGQGDARNLLTERPSVFSADQLYDQLVAFIRSLFLASTANNSPARTTFHEESRRARATETDFGVGIAAKAKAIGFSIAPLRVEYASWYPSARGVVVGGKGFLMEDYSGIDIAPPDGEKLFLDIAEVELNKIYDGLGTEMRKGWVKSREAYEKSQKAKVTPTAAADLDKLDVASWETAARPAATAAPAPYLGYATSAPAGKPQYGIGDFYSLLATEPLSGPVTIEIAYDEAELAGISESTIGLYRWNKTERDWVHVAGAGVDTAANRVTATVSEMGLYTLGTRMPAGKLTWQVVSWSGSGGNTTVALRAVGVRMNDGSPVPPDTLMHVAAPGVDPALVTFGTPDASPLPGYQAVVGSDGEFTVTVTLPGNLASLDILGFSDVGTAVGEAKVVRP